MKSRTKIWFPGHYTTKIINGRKTRVWVLGYYGFFGVGNAI